MQDSPKQQALTFTCPKGLEGLLQEELISLGASEVKPGIAFVACHADLDLAYKACMWSRLASRVLWPVGEGQGESAEALYDCIKSINWIEHFSDRQSFKIHFTGKSQDIRNTHFGALKAKDAICDYFRELTGSRPDVSDQPDIHIHVRLHKGIIKISIDFAGEPLHKRGYRQSQGAAPLKENLAAAIVMRSGWPSLMEQEEAALLDPMCGSGTLLIEAALMAANIAPGLLRSQFAVERWKQHQRNEWRAIKADAQEKKEQALQAETELTLLGYDMDERVIQKAKQNATRAGVQHYVHFSVQALADWKREKGLPEDGLIVCNPPYGERLSDEVAIGALYAAMGNKAKQYFPGWKLAIFTGNPQQAYQFKMRADKQYQMFNGAIPSKLMVYGISKDSDKHFVESTEARSIESGDSANIKLNDGAQMVANRIKKNLKKVVRYAKKKKTNCYRVYDADMPEYAVAVDVYGDWVHVQEYAPPKSVDPEKAQNRLRDVLDALPVALNVEREKIALKQRQVQKGKKQYQKVDEQASLFEVQEGNCRFYVNMTDYLDTGLFLDHRPIRTEIETLAQGKDFLNLFSYTCTASVHAAVGGARSTTSVDMSQTYLNWGRRNLTLNGIAEKYHHFIQADCLQWLKDAQNESKRFDLIFMDPPSFSNSKRMMGVLDVQRDHVELIELAMGLLKPSGTLIFSNNLKRFKLDSDALNKFNVIDISAKTIPDDFARNGKIHQCFQISAN